MAGVEVDTKELTRYAKKLAVQLDLEGRATARDAADRTARTIQDDVPVLTGRLKASVKVVDVGDGYGVSYGQAVPYARKIERRDHTVEQAINDAQDEYYRAQLKTAQQQARRA